MILEALPGLVDPAQSGAQFFPQAQAMQNIVNIRCACRVRCSCALRPCLCCMGLFVFGDSWGPSFAARSLPR